MSSNLIGRHIATAQFNFKIQQAEANGSPMPPDEIEEILGMVMESDADRPPKIDDQPSVGWHIDPNILH